MSMAQIPQNLKIPAPTKKNYFMTLIYAVFNIKGEVLLFRREKKKKWITFSYTLKDVDGRKPVIS